MSKAFTDIAGYYDRLVKTYGHDPRACDYGRPESQQTKFKVLAELADYTDQSVLDVGCGFADFAEFLQHRFKNVDYTGIDLSPHMIARAKEHRPGLRVSVGNLLDIHDDRQFDIVTANGIFYLLGTDAAALSKRLIRRMYECARRAIAFNSLSAWTGDRQRNEYYADPLEMVRFCRELSPWITLRHDYHGRDFTVYVYKQRNPV